MERITIEISEKDKIYLLKVLNNHKEHLERLIMFEKNVSLRNNYKYSLSGIKKIIAQI